jgi:hypothetical protein
MKDMNIAVWHPVIFNNLDSRYRAYRDHSVLESEEGDSLAPTGRSLVIRSDPQWLGCEELAMQIAKYTIFSITTNNGTGSKMVKQVQHEHGLWKMWKVPAHFLNLYIFWYLLSSFGFFWYPFCSIQFNLFSAPWRSMKLIVPTGHEVLLKHVRRLNYRTRQCNGRNQLLLCGSHYYIETRWEERSAMKGWQLNSTTLEALMQHETRRVPALAPKLLGIAKRPS